MPKFKSTQAICQNPNCKKKFQLSKFQPHCTLCPECRKEKNRKNYRDNQRAKYHAMKEEDRELKEKCRGQNIPPTRWDLYRARKKRERERRKQSSADENSSEMTLRRIKRIFSETDLFRGNSRSDIILQITSLLVLVVSFLNHGCLEDFQEHLEIILKKLCHVPGGSASSSTIPSYVKIEKFLHVVVRCLPILGPRFSVTPEEV